MKYKHSRERLAKLFFEYEDKCDFLEDLLAKKEDRKENKHNPQQSCDESWSCTKCHMPVDVDGNWSKCSIPDHTPSPLEGFEEIGEIQFPPFDPPQDDNVSWVIKKVEEKVNQLISNQKKLYQYIKEKL